MTPVMNRKIIKTAVLFVLLLLIVTPPLYRTVFESPVFKSADEAGLGYVDEAFNRALISFALARTTNAIISVIQDSEIDIAPAGIGVTIAIGEALDPVNDMIERFSWVMLVSLVSLGIQKLMIEISPWISVKFVLLPALAMILISLWSREDWKRKLNYYGRRLIFIAILIRFCIPVMAMVNEQVYSLFLDPHYTKAVAGIEQGNVALRNMDPMAENIEGQDQEGIWAGIRKKAEKVGEIIDLQHRVSRMKSRLTGMIENLLKMIAVFIVNTVILPVGFLWLLSRLFRAMTGSSSLQQIESILIGKISGGGGQPAAIGNLPETVHPAGDRENAEVDKKDENIETEQ